MLVIAVGAAAAVSPRLAVVVAVVVLIITIGVTPPPSPSSSLFLATRYPSLAPALTLTLVGLATQVLFRAPYRLLIVPLLS
ncbi:hypothetical protein BJV77DRAFT_1069110 [Russula vinacea]|nr:hypothetical protein BJV77DRAFT_1069110 [Russula vinacea]